MINRSFVSKDDGYLHTICGHSGAKCSSKIYSSEAQYGPELCANPDVQPHVKNKRCARKAEIISSKIEIENG
jgi:hypothetical protein